MPSRFSVSKLRSPQHSTAAVELLRERDPKNDQKSGQKSNQASVAHLLTPLSLPRHLAVIMDGNGRWAKARGKSRLEGHKAGANAAERILDCVLKKGIPYLTLFAFSSENWRRSDEEVQGLMRLLEHYLVRNRKSFLEDRRVRLSVFGDKTKLPSSLVVHLDDFGAPITNPQPRRQQQRQGQIERGRRKGEFPAFGPCAELRRSGRYCEGDASASRALSAGGKDKGGEEEGSGYGGKSDGAAYFCSTGYGILFPTPIC